MPHRLTVATARAAVVVVLGLAVACSGQRPAAQPAPAGPATVPVPADAQTAVVARVVDGDTLRLVGRGAGPLPAGHEERVRLLQIDAPEVGAKRACFGAEATGELGRLTPPGSSVRVLADRELRDRYGRALLYVWTERGAFVNEALVASGHASAVLYRPNDRYIDVMRAAERQAKAAGRGLWSACPADPTAATPTPRSRSPEPPATPPPPTRPPALPAHVETVRSFATAEQLAGELAAAEQAIRDPGTPAVALVTAARTQQLAYRQLVVRPDWRAAVRAALPPALHRTLDANVTAGTQLRALTEPRPALPNWRIVAPAPAAELMGYYREAQRATGVHWSYLAAINLVETKMGRIRGLSTAGARGPMQFLPSTWAEIGEGDIDDARDSIRAAARYLVRRGGGDIERGLRGYNNSARYVTAVLAYAREMQRDASSYRGYYHWQVTYRWSRGDVLLLEGYDGRRR